MAMSVAVVVELRVLVPFNDVAFAFVPSNGADNIGLGSGLR
jgi:hypothetical protein